MDLMQILQALPLLGIYLGVSLLGAGSIWGFLFLIKIRLGDKDKIWQYSGTEMFSIVFFGFVFIMAGYWSESMLLKSVASHDLSSTVAENYASQISLLNVQFPVIIFSLLVFVLGTTFIRKNSEFFFKDLEKFYLALFSIALLVISTDLISVFDLTSFYRVLWHFSNILVFGTVAILGHLYVRKRKEKVYIQTFSEYLSLIQTIIWFGIGLKVFLSLLSPVFIPVFSHILVQQVLLGLIICVFCVITSTQEAWLNLKKKKTVWSELFPLLSGSSLVVLTFSLLVIESLNIYILNLGQLLSFCLGIVALILTGALIAKYDN